jgi:hypothetical protein
LHRKIDAFQCFDFDLTSAWTEIPSRQLTRLIVPLFRLREQSKNTSNHRHQRHETRSGMRQLRARETFRARGTGSSRATPRRMPEDGGGTPPPVALEQTCKAPRIAVKLAQTA